MKIRDRRAWLAQAERNRNGRVWAHTKLAGSQKTKRKLVTPVPKRPRHV